MSEQVHPAEIEAILGRERDQWHHYAKAVSAERAVYVLHPHACLRVYGDDLRECPYSQALDKGIDTKVWPLDVALKVAVEGQLVPRGN